MVFYQMDIEEVSDRFMAHCFVNGLEAYDGEINLGVKENMILNEYAVILCLEHEMKRGNKVVKKELIVALRGEFYFVKFIINPEEDDVEPGVILGRSFLRMTKAITDFGAATVTIYPEIDPFLEDIEEEEKSLDDWDHLLDFKLDDVQLLGEEELPLFVCKTGKSSCNKKRAMENLEFFYQDIRTSSSAGGREEMKKVDREITMINLTQAEAIGILTNVLCQVGVTTLIAKFVILDIPIDRDVPIVVGQGFLRTIGGIVNILERLFSNFDGFCHQTFRAARYDVMRNTDCDSDDEEEYQIKRNKFGAPIYGPKPVPYLNCNDPAERSLAIQIVTNPFRKISVRKKAISFLGSLPVPLNHVNWKPDYKCCYTKEEQAIGQWWTKIRLSDPYGNIYLQGTHDDEAESLRSKLSRQNETMEEELLPQVHHEFLLWEGCSRDAKSRLGLYKAVELDEEGFNVYFEGGLHSDEHFNAQEYWLSISQEENLGLSRSHTFTIRNPILRVIHKMITCGLCQRTTGYANVAWLIARWMKRKRAGAQKESQICCGQFILKIARKSRVLIEDVARSLSALIYCRDLDTIKDLIDSEGKLIPEDPQPRVPRVGILRPSRASMQDLYDMIVPTFTTVSTAVSAATS
nr:hypothetical protein [Tanacetum cinerariifolium]